MEIGYCSRNGVEQTNEDLKNPGRENEPGSSILQKFRQPLAPATFSLSAGSARQPHCLAFLSAVRAGGFCRTIRKPL
jgi:hypothetical protein